MNNQAETGFDYRNGDDNVTMRFTYRFGAPEKIEIFNEMWEQEEEDFLSDAFNLFDELKTMRINFLKRRLDKPVGKE